MARWSRFRRLFGPEPKADVDAELAFHVEMRARELVEQGVPPERARALALRRFGDYDSSRAACVEISKRRERRMARTEYMTELRQDVGYALRMLRRAPGFTAVALTTLALGIGANSAIFSVVQGVLLAPLPFRDADRLYRVTTLYPDGTPYSLSPPDFMSVREQTRAFEQVEAFSGGVFTMLGAGEPREVRGTNVSDGLFGLLGLPVTLGRTLLPGENQPGRDGVAVLDHGFWQRQFGGDRSVLGRTVTIAGAPVEIVGVLAPGARLLDDADIYTPLVYSETFSAATATGRRGEFLTVIGRAKPGMALAQVDDDLRRIGTQLQATFRETNDTLTFNALSLNDVMLGDVRTPLLVLLGAVGFVLLVACANVANLLLARGIGAPGGAGRSLCARRRPRPAAAPAPHRGGRPRRRRRGGRARDRLLRDAGARRRAARGHSAPGRGRRERRRGRRSRSRSRSRRAWPSACCRRCSSAASACRARCARARVAAPAAAGIACGRRWSWPRWRSPSCCSSVRGCSSGASSS